MRVLLIKSRSLKSKVFSQTPAMGVLSLAAYVREQLDAEVHVADVVMMDDAAREIADVIRDTKPDLIGLSGLTCEAYMLHQAAGIARSIQPAVPIIAGGPYPSSDPDRLLADWNVDAAAIGEGEETLVEVARLVRDHGPSWRSAGLLATVPGIAWRDADGRITTTDTRAPISDLDSLPLPAWDAIDAPWFFDRRGMSTCGIRPYLPIFTSRGCPYQCTYCHNLFGRRYRARSPDSVIDEIVELGQRYGVNDFEFLDDTVNLDRRRFTNILTGLLERGLHPKLSFPNGVRTDLLDEETIRLLHEVGVGEISVAVETVSPRLQKLTKKNLDLGKVERNIDLMAELRMFTRGFFMLGYPTETEEEIEATIEWAARSRLHLASFHITNPFPGTVVFEEFEKLGKLRDDINSIDYEYTGSPFNGSTVPDERFQALVRRAFLRFYAQPGRVARILRDRPYWNGYHLELRSLLSKFINFRPIREALRT